MLQFAILGPLEVRRDGRPLAIGGTRQRALLGMLIVHANAVVPAARLLDELWPARASEDTAALRVRVSQLRRALGSDAGIVSRDRGYVLELPLGQLDVHLHERFVTDAERARVGDPEAAARLLRRALALWRGPPLADLAHEPFAQAEIARLEDLRVGTLEQLMEDELAAGRDRAVVGELAALVREHPLRERLRAQLMLAQYRTGRQADALETYQGGRRLLVEELGVEPAPALRALHRAILGQDPALEPAGLVAPPPAGEVRKTVTILVCSAHAGAADPERLRPLRAAWRSEGERIVDRHGGRIVGAGRDLVAVFGLPGIREDDALRAVHAAWELAHTGLPTSVGVETGEVVVGGESIVAGEVETVAARLEAAAAGGEVLLGARTHALVSRAVRAEEASVPGHRGTRPLHAHRLVELQAGPPATAARLDTPLVGRRAEVAQLRAAFDRAVRERRCQLVTLLGEAGIGKTRLAEEAQRGLAGQARVLTGRCLPGGEGDSLRPLRELLRQFGGDVPVISSLDDAPVEVARWCGRLAQERPLVLVFDDIHWAEPVLLDLVEHLATAAADIPLLLLCLARTELLDVRPRWAGGLRDATSVTLTPLADADARRLAEALIEDDPSAADAVVARAGGNPLFVEQLVALLREAGVEREAASLPPTVEALIAARLDWLPRDEQAVLQTAAVLGDRFAAPDVEALCEIPVDGPLASLVRRELLRGPAPGEPQHRFRHVLVREAAYRRLPKATRARLHEVAADRAPSAERAAHHLDCAAALREELAPGEAATRALAERASATIALVGRAAFERADWRVAVALLGRADELATPDDPARAARLYDIGTSLITLGQPARAAELLARAQALAEAEGDERTAWLSRIDLLLVQATRNPAAVSILEDARVARAALPALRRLPDTARAQARAWQLSALVARARGRAAEAERAAREVIAEARAAGAYREEAWGRWSLAEALLDGPEPIQSASQRCQAMLPPLDDLRVGDVGLVGTLALFAAMQGRFAEARALVARARTQLELLGHVTPAVATWQWEGAVELLAGDPAAAAPVLREGCERAVAAGLHDRAACIAIDRARALVQLDRLAEADAATAAARGGLWPHHRLWLSRWQRAAALVALGRGDLEAAREHAGAAVRLLRTSDCTADRADAALVQATVTRDGGQAALAAYEQKGHSVGAARAAIVVAG
jgi:DNA-binding SARP family transcriptional activator